MEDQFKEEMDAMIQGTIALELYPKMNKEDKISIVESMKHIAHMVRDGQYAPMGASQLQTTIKWMNK